MRSRSGCWTVRDGITEGLGEKGEKQDDPEGV
jgi:hypothetical protein